MTAAARAGPEDGTILRDPRSRVPVRTIAATIAMVLLTAAVLLLGWEVRRVLTWIVVAALLAVILGPLVDITERRLRLRRTLATLVVFLVAIVALAGILTLFIRPLATEGPQFIDRVPSYVEQARTGRGPVGDLVQRYHLDQYLQRNQARLRESANRLTTPALGVLRSIFSTVVALVTIFVLTFLMVLQGPKLLAGWVAVLPQRRQERVRRVAADCAKAVTGYMTGNLVISVIAGTVTYVVLWIMGVPYRGVVALFVGFADLIPLVGATLGAVVAIAVAALHSLPAAIVVLVVFVVYQQLENHVLQPVIMARTVQLSALTVLASILIGVELFGFLGALLAIPVAGVLHVIGHDLYDSYQGRLKPDPTTGTDQIPVSQPRPSEPGDPNPATSPPPRTTDPIGPATQPSRQIPAGSTPHHQEAPMDRDDRSTDTGMLGSDAENPGPGRDTRQTDSDPAETSSEHPTRTMGMSGADPQRTRLGTQETSSRPLAGAPQDTASSGQADTGMVGSETENPGPGRDSRRTDPAATADAEDPEATSAMSDVDPDRTRLGSHDPGPARH